MSISINCKLSLSKKLRALLGKEASLTLVSQDIVDGKGTAILVLDSDTFKADVKPEEMGETSIMLVPVEMSEEHPNSNSPSHASLFSSVPNKHSNETIIKKIAVVNAPEEGEEAKAIKKDVEVPKAFSTLKNEECRTWIKNMEELVDAVNVAKNKKSDIDLDSAQNNRERAILQEMKEKSEAIDTPAWIVNDKVGMLSVNDLNISLPFNAPFDLSNISAKRIIASKDLKGLLKAGYVRFISPREKDQFVLKTVDAEAIGGLEVFDNHEQAEESITSGVSSRNTVIDDRNAMTITEADVDTKTEEESMVLNLTQNMPTVKTISEIPSSNRTSTHGNTTNTTPKNPNIKTIKKLFE